MIFDATQLDAELRAAGLRIHGCSSDGRIDWITAPSMQDESRAQAALTAHVPDQRASRQQAEREERIGWEHQMRERLPESVAGWRALAPAQREELVWLGLRIQTLGQLAPGGPGI